MEMKKIVSLGLILVGMIFSQVTAGDAQQTWPPKPTDPITRATASTAPVVRGMGPYVLGAPADSVLTGRAGWDRLPARDTDVPESVIYAQQTSLPIGGTLYPATVLLAVWHGQIAGIAVIWRADAFETVGTWFNAYCALYSQLFHTYGEPNPGFLHNLSYEGMTFNVTGDNGNWLHAEADPDKANIVMIYSTAAYDQAVQQVPKPAVNY
jgi:hypothetical protein